MNKKEIIELVEKELKYFPRRVLAGTIMAWAGKSENLPDGWKICNGEPLDRKKYKDLFEAIGTNWGGEADTRFNLPDLRGYFLRGVDDGAKNDPDAKNRHQQHFSDNVIGGVVGSFQTESMMRHVHIGNLKLGAEPAPDGGARSSRAAGAHGAITPTWQTPGLVDEFGGNETRPKNAYVHWIIKL